MTWAEVVVHTPAARRSQTFTYLCPVGLDIQPGLLVRVPFGSRILAGVVFETHDRAPDFGTREIAEVLDPQPILTPNQISLAQRVASYYHSTLGEAVQSMVPVGSLRQSITLYEVAGHTRGDSEPDPSREADEQPLSSASSVDGSSAEPATSMAEGELLECLGDDALSAEDLAVRLPTPLRKRAFARMLRELVRRGTLKQRSELLGPKVRPRIETVYTLTATRARIAAMLAEAAVRAPKQAAALAWLLEQAPETTTEEAALAPATEWIGAEFRGAVGGSVIALALVSRGVVSAVEREIRRDPLAGRLLPHRPAARLTPDQERVWNEIAASGLESSGVHLIHGVTGSGKTEIYLRLVEEMVARDRQVIVLVPEIALIAQTIQRFAGRFPGLVAVLHSGLTPGEHYDEWRRIRDGLASIVVGSRSAIFAPLPRLGAIIVDEEHEWAYKQDRPPRYHVREVAAWQAELASIPVVLGSATPDVVTYARARAGRYQYHELAERVAPIGHLGAIDAARGSGDVWVSAELPAVEVVNLRDELKAGGHGVFSGALRAAMTETLARDEQIILYLNRRGAASLVMCRDCGFVPRCRRCDTPLVYHSADDFLVCHLCGRRLTTPDRCPSCQSSRIHFFGVGTQRVEDEVRREFPTARVVRWDRDAVRTRRAHEEALRLFQAREADVLIGTQMVAKGLDLPFVTLVGVITADTALNLPDMRAAERTFQLLTQVAGRAGRGVLPGRAIIQTFAPEHPAIVAAARHDYKSFAAAELRFRREHGYPPYGQIARIVGASASAARVEREALALVERLAQKRASLGLAGLDLFGPTPSYRRQIRGQYRWQIVLRGQRAGLEALLADFTPPLGFSLEIDPLTLL